ncbi:MAG: alkaline phosphatase family protein [Verrucomicrobia bacterium]|nr:alkaline phosphatase family protein [Verrucomicrobiota bacterium]
MINEISLEAVSSSVFTNHFCHPLYSSYCFSKIPATIEKLFFPESTDSLPGDALIPGSYDHVILLFLDAFGWSFFEEFKDKISTLQKLEKEGVITKLTSLFPSTTAAHVTCINTGLLPVQTGIYEWFIYEPKLNDIIAPLPFSYAGDRKPGTLPLDPKDLFPRETLYHRLAERGVTCSAFQSQTVANSPYSQSVLNGATVYGYKKSSQAFEMILSTLQKGKTYSFFYFGDIDAIGHRKGIHSTEFAKTVEKIWAEIDNFIQKLPPKSALLITADHGMVEVDPNQTYYLNKKIPNIAKYLQFGQRDKPLAPAGSCRDFFLHALPESLPELKEILGLFLKEKGEIYETEKLLEAGLFGKIMPTANFLSRVGNLVILPYRGEAVWWYEKDRFQQNFYGAHGGLTRGEMEIPFLFYST